QLPKKMPRGRWHEDHALEVTTKGFAGSECREASKLLEKALGQRSAERLTAEFYQQAGCQQVNRQAT
ncbi:MAG: DUF2997 domain-containing protein, partial [Pirellulaceae bacterium]